jgi:hypothetical protein
MDARTAGLFPDSGCKNATDSPTVLAALGTAKRVDALARGRHGTGAVVIAVADARVIVVAVGFFSDMGHTARQTSPVLLDVPVAAVGFSVGQTVVLDAPTERFEISGVRDPALLRLSKALAAASGFTTPGSAASGSTASGFSTAAFAGPGKPARADWKTAEVLVVQYLQRFGFSDARATANGADGGVDVVATGAVAQVKHWAQPVGQPPLRDLFGVAQAAAAQALFFSFSGYTPSALEWANANGMALFTYTLDGGVQACNSTAHQLSGSGKSLGFFAKARADRYQREQAGLRREIDRLTSRMDKRTQSRRARARQAAGAAASLLLRASRTLDSGDVLPPSDRRREDTYKIVRDALTQVKRLL